MGKILNYARVILGVASGPGLLLILPFLLSYADYGRLFGFITIIQLVGLFSSLGLEIIAARINMPFRIYFAVLVFTTFVAILIYYSIQGAPVSIYVIFIAFVSTLANNTSLVAQNQYLFNGDVVRYARYGVFRAVLLIIALLACIYANIEIEKSWTIALVVAVVVPYFVLRSSHTASARQCCEQWGLVAVLNALTAAIPMAALNSLASLPFLAERLAAKNGFQPELFAKYAVCVTMVTPLAYLGNMVQNQVIAKANRIDRSTAIGAAKILLVLGAIYLLILFSFGHLVFPHYFRDRVEFLSLVIPSACWTLLYCTFAFPLAAITQKQADSKILAKCSIASVAAIAVLYCWYAWVFKQEISLDLPWKTACVASVICSVLIVIRTYYIWPLTLPTTSR